AGAGERRGRVQLGDGGAGHLAGVGDVHADLHRAVRVDLALVGRDTGEGELAVAQAVAEGVGRRAGEVLVRTAEAAGLGRGQTVVLLVGQLRIVLVPGEVEVRGRILPA